MSEERMLSNLEEEEARIMRELRELDAVDDKKDEARKAMKNDPEGTLCTLLLQCEKEVREAKGYIANEGPPLQIVRVRFGEVAPKGATFLSRPRGTGVDFTVPVTIKAYTDIIKKPIFLNQIRDKIKAKVYNSHEDYLDDMRLLARNTAQFNKGPELSWVVQHARFLLEAAEEAVTARSQVFHEMEDALRQFHGNRHKSPHGGGGASGKRKRSSSNAVDHAGTDGKNIPGVGSAIEVYWPNYRRWFLATITERSGSNVHVLYDEDNTDQWVNLNHGLKWRMRNARAAGGSGARSKRPQEPPAPKRRKSSSGTPHGDATSVVVAGGASAEDLDSLKAELFTKVDDVKEGLTDSLSNHLERIDMKLMRSDVLERVLLAVQDCQTAMESKFIAVEERNTRLEEKVEALTKKLAEREGNGIAASIAGRLAGDADAIVTAEENVKGVERAAEETNPPISPSKTVPSDKNNIDVIEIDTAGDAPEGYEADISEAVTNKATDAPDIVSSEAAKVGDEDVTMNGSDPAKSHEIAEDTTPRKDVEMEGVEESAAEANPSTDGPAGKDQEEHSDSRSPTKAATGPEEPDADVVKDGTTLNQAQEILADTREQESERDGVVLASSSKEPNTEETAGEVSVVGPGVVSDADHQVPSAADTKLESPADLKVSEAPVEGETPARTEASPEVETTARTEASPEVETIARTEASAEGETIARTEASAEGETPARTEARAQSETPARTEAPSEGDTPTRTEAPAEDETPACTEAPAEGDTPARTDVPAEVDTPSHTEAPAKDEASTGTEAPRPRSPEEDGKERGSDGDESNSAAAEKEQVAGKEAAKPPSAKNLASPSEIEEPKTKDDDDDDSSEESDSDDSDGSDSDNSTDNEAPGRYDADKPQEGIAETTITFVEAKPHSIADMGPAKKREIRKESNGSTLENANVGDEKSDKSAPVGTNEAPGGSAPAETPSAKES